MRVLWLCNICPPAAAAALGLSYSVREGWITGALNRYLEEGIEEQELKRAASKLELGICFPAEGETAQLGKDVFLTPFRRGGEGKEGREDDSFRGFVRGEAQDSAARSVPDSAGQALRAPGRRVRLYGFHEDLRRPEVYDFFLEERFSQILKEFQPDLVHIFGTEFPHALAMARAFQRPERLLVGMQGLMGECTAHYMADLPLHIQNRATLRDRLRRDSLGQQQEKFALRAQRERETLALCGHVAGRTEFDRKGSLALNPKAVYHTMNETMRDCFYEGRWSRETCRSHQIFASQGDYPIKGLHYLLQAMPAILGAFPDARLWVAGNSITRYGTWKEKLKISGYGKYLRELIRENGLQEHVTVLGQLSAGQMKEAFLSSHLFVCPSAVENSPNSLGEAMLLGVPCAAARTGGIPSMAEDGKEALFFEKGDVDGIARCVTRIFREDPLARRLSEGGAARARRNHDGDANYRQMLEVYRQILDERRLPELHREILP